MSDFDENVDLTFEFNSISRALTGIGVFPVQIDAMLMINLMMISLICLKPNACWV